MECVYSRFESYDFERDVNFKNGTKSLQISSVPGKTLEVKLFFYNRFVEPIDSKGYKEWRRRFCVTEHLSPFTADTEERQLQESNHEPNPESNCSNTDKSTERSAESLSFGEVMRLIEAGKDIPGLSKLEIKPSNECPTPSQMVRRPKPWEKSSITK